MHYILRLFHSLAYWLAMHIGCYYDSINHVYVIFTLPFIIDLPFIIMQDTMHTKFNQIDDRLDCLIPMLFTRTPGMILFIGKNEVLSTTFLDMLKQGSQRGECVFL
jgi:hypothetical protein